jgi:Xaa-Pro aminopeptidase
MFSAKEKSRRLKAAATVMDKAGLRAIYLPGNSMVGTYPFGCQRYFTDSRTIFFIRSAVLFKDKSVAVATDLMSKLHLVGSSFIHDAVINQDQVKGVIEILETNGIKNGRVGTIFEVLPAAWLLQLNEELPDVEFVDVSRELFSVRTSKSAEELEAQRVCASIADEGYRVMCNIVKPGMYENEVVAEIDRAMQRMGAEESFALVASGKFSIKDNRLLPLHNYSALNRRIEAGDVVSAEITPRYNGYWTQKVRTVCVGVKNEDAETLKQLIVDSINEAKPLLKPKTPICDIVKRMREYVEDAGYKFVMPCGHLAGTDLDEGGATDENTMLLESGMLVILHPTIITEEMDTGIFWGESYIITDEGYEEPMQSGDELFTAAL